MGLSAAAAQQRLQQYGPNQLAEKKKEPGWQALGLRRLDTFANRLTAQRCWMQSTGRCK